MPYFSILIPVYNQVGKMDKCISSIMEQTFGDFEAIFVNDGSTDDSLSMLNGYAAKDPRFRIISHEENLSLLAARFTGMREASGKVIVFLDSDDYIEKTMLMELHDAYEKTQADIIWFGCIAEPLGMTLMPFFCEDLLKEFLEGKIRHSIWKNAYSARMIRAVIETGEPFYCNMGEDVYFSGVFYSNAETHVTLDRVLYHYVYVDGMSAQKKSNSIKKIREHVDSVRACENHLSAYLKKYKPEYGGKTRTVLMNMLGFLLETNLSDEEDPVNAVRCIMLFDQEDTQELFENACRVMLRNKYMKPSSEGGFGEQFVTDSEI